MNDETGAAPHPISRRRFLQGSALAGFGAFVAACTGGGATTEPGATQAPASVPIPTPPPATAGPTVAPTPKTVTGPLHWAQWPAYIDLVGKAGTEGKYAPGLVADPRGVQEEVLAST